MQVAAGFGRPAEVPACCGLMRALAAKAEAKLWIVTVNLLRHE